tara:strand:- start:257 stop:994 length:738 start_codon:yes stop_codon:yes gene_type:complete
MKNFLDKFITEKREKLFLNGFVSISKNDFLNNQEYFSSLKEIDSNKENFELQSKQKGTFTLKAAVQQQNKEFFLDNLFNSKIYELSCLITGQKLYLTNFKHFLTKGLTPALGWHRDTYFRKNKFHGLIPTAYKLAIYATDVMDEDGCTAFIRGSHRLDFNSNLFDRYLTFFTNRTQKIDVKKGDAILFNVNVLHNRLRAKRSNSKRSVTIYGFALSKFYQQNYFKDQNEIVIKYFNNQLEKKITW